MITNFRRCHKLEESKAAVIAKKNAEEEFVRLGNSVPDTQSILRSIICQLVTYERSKTKENVKLLAITVVMVAYERWLLTRGSKYSVLSCKLLVFWKTGHRGEVVTYERWLQPENQLYFSYTLRVQKMHMGTCNDIIYQQYYWQYILTLADVRIVAFLSRLF